MGYSPLPGRKGRGKGGERLCAPGGGGSDWSCEVAGGGGGGEVKERAGVSDCLTCLLVEVRREWHWHWHWHWD